MQRAGGMMLQDRYTLLFGSCSTERVAKLIALTATQASRFGASMTAFLTRPSAPAPHLEALLLLLTSASPHYNGKLVSYSVLNAQPAPSYHVRVKVSRAKNKQEVSKDSPCSEFPGQLLSLLEEAPQCHEVRAMR